MMYVWIIYEDVNHIFLAFDEMKLQGIFLKAWICFDETSVMIVMIVARLMNLCQLGTQNNRAC